MDATIDYSSIKTRQQATWASGDFAIIGTTLQIVGESLAEAADIRAGERVLDVAAGNGNATLAAARRFAAVTSTDFVPALLEKGRQRAEAEGLEATFEVADAEALPFASATFDAALSTFGVMFTPEPSRAAAELLRVVRPGGRIGLANWTPDGVIGELFKVMAAHVPPPAGLTSPALWGTPAFLGQLFGRGVADLRCERRTFNFRYRSSAHMIDVFREFYGPTHKAFGTLDATRALALTADFTDLLDRMNVAGPDSLVVPADYLEVVVTRA
jgi:SAM-dependent methyltransferase